MIEQLKEQIKVVAEARRKSQEMAGKKKALYDEFQATHCEFFGDVATAATVTSEVEDKLGELTLQVYAQTGNKAPAPRVGIRVKTVLGYLASEAMDWAMEHRLALKLDSSAFEKIAKTSSLPFVTISEEPQATIATQLEEAESGTYKRTGNRY